MRLEIQCDQSMQDILSSYVVRVDEPKFAQVIRNLVSNALKFTPAEGSVTVCIEALPANNASSTSHTPGPDDDEQGGEGLAATRGVDRFLSTPIPRPVVGSVTHGRLRVSVTDSGAGISQVNY